MGIKCSKCGGPLRESAVDYKYWCGRCGGYVCEKCLKAGHVCPTCGYQTQIDKNRPTGIVFIVMSVIIAGIMILTMFVMDFGDSLSDYDVGEHVLLTGNIMDSDGPVIRGTGTPGNISWSYRGEFTLAERRDDITVVVTKDTMIDPYYLEPDIDTGTGTYNYTFSSKDTLLINATVREYQNGTRYYEAVGISMKAPDGGKIPPGKNVLIPVFGRIASGTDSPLWGTGPGNNVSWHHNGSLVIAGEQERYFVRILNDTRIFTEGVASTMDQDTGYHNYTYLAGDNVEAACLVDDLGSDNTTYSTQAIFVSDPWTWEETGSEEPLKALTVLLLLSIPSLFTVIGLVLVLKGRGRKKSHEEHSLVSGPPSMQGVKGPLPSGDFVWKENTARSRHVIFLRVFVVMMFLTPLIVAGYTMFIKDDSTLFSVLLTGGISLVIGGFVFGFFIYVFRSAIKTCPVRAGVSKEGIKVEYERSAGGDSFDGARWEDIESFEPVGGGFKILVTLKTGERSHIGDIDIEVGRFLKSKYIEYRKEAHRKRSVENRADVDVDKENMVEDTLIRPVQKETEANADSAETLEWKKVTIDQWLTVMLTIAIGLIFSLIVVIPMVLLDIHQRYMVIGGGATVVVSFFLTLLMQRPKVKGYGRIGISATGIHIDLVGDKLGDVPGYVCYDNVKDIKVTNGIDISTRDGYNIQLVMVPKRIRSWVHRAYLDHRKGKRRGGYSSVSMSGIRWTDNTARKRSRNTIILLSVISIGMAFMSIFLMPGMFSTFEVQDLIFPLIPFVSLGVVWGLYMSYLKIPMAVGTSTKGLAVKWSDRLKNREKLLLQIAWKDVEKLTEQRMVQAHIGTKRARGIMVRDVMGKEYNIEPIGDDCARAILMGWKGRKGRKK